MESTQTLFDTLYEGLESVIKTIKKPHAERSLKRKFQSAYDEAEKRIDDAELTIHQAREKVLEIDINLIVYSELEKEQALKVSKIIKHQYKELFGEELK